MWKPTDCKLALAGSLALALSLGAGGALAQEAAQEQEAVVASQTQAPTVLICKSIAVTGTRIKREYCLTQEDWDDIREESRQTLERLMGIGTET